MAGLAMIPIRPRAEHAERPVLQDVQEYTRYGRYLVRAPRTDPRLPRIALGCNNIGVLACRHVERVHATCRIQSICPELIRRQWCLGGPIASSVARGNPGGGPIANVSNIRTAPHTSCTPRPREPL